MSFLMLPLPHSICTFLGARDPRGVPRTLIPFSVSPPAPHHVLLARCFALTCRPVNLHLLTKSFA